MIGDCHCLCAKGGCDDAGEDDGYGHGRDVPVMPDRRLRYEALPPVGPAHSSYQVPAVEWVPRPDGK